MSTQRILMISGAVLAIVGFAITVISTRILHIQEGTPIYIGAAFGVVGAIIWLIAKGKS